jgi:hypothetical protein
VRITVGKATLAATIVGAMIAGLALLNDLVSGHKLNPVTGASSQITSGSDSPAISGVRGNVTIYRDQKQ